MRQGRRPCATRRRACRRRTCAPSWPIAATRTHWWAPADTAMYTRCSPPCAPGLAAARGPAIELAAEAVLTTDTRVKLASRSVWIGGVEATIAAFAKGGGMIAPELATLLAFVTTDLAVTPGALQSALAGAMQTSFEMVTVDGDMSTNDAVFALANGLAGNAPVEQGTAQYEGF